MRAAGVAARPSFPEVVIMQVSNGVMENYNYLVVEPNSQQSVIIDPAWEIATIDAVIAQTGSQLQGVLLTHTHPDHADLASVVAHSYDVPIWVSPEEIAWSGFYDERMLMLDEMPFVLGQMLIQPIFTPGHTPGGYCFLIAQHLFTGDTLFAEGCGICDDAAAARVLFDSLQGLKQQLRPDTRIYPGHCYGKPPGQLFSYLCKYNIYLQFTNADHFAGYLMRGKQNMKMFEFS